MKKLIVIFGVVVLLGLVAGGVYYLIERLSEQNSENQVPGTKTYRNEEFGFEFQYPANWTLHPTVLKSPFSKFELIGTTPEENVPNTIVPSLLVNIVTPDFADRAVVSFNSLNANTSVVIVAGVKGVKYEYEFASTLRITVDLPFEENRILLGANRKHADVFNQVIATFKFLK